MRAFVGAVLIGALALFTACQDNSVTANNSPPEASILVPESGFSVLEGSELTFRGQASDNITAAEELVVSWSSSLDGQLHEGVPNAEGISEFTTTALGEGDHVITLRVVDPDGASGNDTVDITISPNEPPAIDIDEPTEDGIYYEDVPLILTATVGDAEDDPEDLRVSWSTDAGDTLASDLEPLSTGEVTTTVDLDEGTYVLSATVVDSAGKTAGETVTIDVGPENVGPTCSIDAPEDGSSYIYGEAVLFEATVDDVNVPEDWLTVEWASDQDGSKPC